MNHSSCILDSKLYVSGGLNESSIEVADCSNLNKSAKWYILSVRYHADLHLFSPITNSEILIMKNEDISILDTRSNIIKKVGTNIFKLDCVSNQATRIRNGQVVALAYSRTNDYSEDTYKVFSFSID